MLLEHLDEFPPDYMLLAAANGWKGRAKASTPQDDSKTVGERLEIAGAAGVPMIPMTKQALETMAWANEWDEKHLKGKKS